jgi:hypothetical protein
MGPIETMATVFAVAIITKLIVVAIKPKLLFNLQDSLAKGTKAAMVVYLTLAAWVGYYIFQYFSVVEVAAVMLFTSLLFGIAFIPHLKPFLKIRKEFIGRHVLSKNWLTLIIWIALALWVLYYLFL